MGPLMEPTEASDASITLERHPAILDELVEDEMELLLEDDIDALSHARIVPVAVAQGAVYLATGLWPLVHMRSFEAVTGPKRERWLVKTVGLLVTAIGVTLLVGARSRGAERVLRVLGVTTAAALAGVDLYYAGTRRIRRIYLADAALEVALAVGWLVRSR